MTAFSFKRILDAIIISYPAKVVLTGTLHAKVSKLIDKHDPLLRYALIFSKSRKFSWGGSCSGIWWSIVIVCALWNVTIRCHLYVSKPTFWRSLLTSGESRIIFLPERSSICQHPCKISAINVKKQSRAHLLLTHPVLYILKIQKTYGAF